MDNRSAASLESKGSSLRSGFRQPALSSLSEAKLERMSPQDAHDMRLPLLYWKSRNCGDIVQLVRTLPQSGPFFVLALFREPKNRRAICSCPLQGSSLALTSCTQNAPARTELKNQPTPPPSLDLPHVERQRVEVEAHLAGGVIRRFQRRHLSLSGCTAGYDGAADPDQHIVGHL